MILFHGIYPFQVGLYLLLHATNILLVPGSGFDWPEPDHFRIVMLPEAKELHSAMGKMGAFLDGYRQD